MSEDTFLPLKALSRSRESTLWLLDMHEDIKKYCKLNWRQIFSFLHTGTCVVLLWCSCSPAGSQQKSRLFTPECLNKACFSIIHGAFLP